MSSESKNRCDWADPNDAHYLDYHDWEWGVPVHDDRMLFEFLVLEGAQAGLSWRTILHKRAAYKKAFAGFEPARVAHFGEAERSALLDNAGIVRNRLKIDSAIGNARAFLAVQAEHKSFDAYLWRYVNGVPIQNRWRRHSEVPARTPLSDTLSKDLKKRGFKFVGSTICYAYIQAVGLVNDHLSRCFRHAELDNR